ncbi:preprotein translocase subunit SecE [Desulfosarcina sp. OttesenSCG-928-G10]|nr:preprotein translocase subunit SecE [Desulfosarcina sp. OttesenSCG-928-G10]
MDEAGQVIDAPAAQGAAPPVARKAYTPAAAKPAPVREKTIFDKAIQFLREVRIELKKVTWPSRKQTVGSTVVVLVVVAIISVFLGLVDEGLFRIIRTVLH